MMGELEDLRTENKVLTEENTRLLGVISDKQKEIYALRSGREEPYWALYKGQQDEDCYVAWSGAVEAPIYVGTRDYMLGKGYSTERLDKADAKGTSSMMKANWWGSGGYLIAEQRGILRREHIVEYSRLHLTGKCDKAFNLLEPFDGEDAVRRG